MRSTYGCGCGARGGFFTFSSPKTSVVVAAGACDVFERNKRAGVLYTRARSRDSDVVLWSIVWSVIAKTGVSL